MPDLAGTVVEQTPMRAAIGRRMLASKQAAPHFYVSAEVVVDPLRARLDRLNAGGQTRVTMTAALARACVEALREHPGFNSVWTDTGLLEAEEINLGIAVAVDEGLLAPALLDAGRLGLTEVATALQDLVERARSRRLKTRELSAATFTLSNLGMFDVSAFTAIIAPPQVATLATARPRSRAVWRDGELVEESSLTVTLSADHRALDGADAARWLAAFKTHVEQPERLFASAREEARNEDH